MIDQRAAELIEDTLDQFIGNREMFTALDISKAVQERLKAEDAFVFESHRHLALKQHIHDQCNAELDHTWNRMLIQIENVDVQPFLYYPVEKDPHTYVTKYPVKGKGAVGGQAAVFPTQQFQVVGKPQAAVTTPGTCVFNSADYLHVPRRIVRNMGLQPGNTLHVLSDGNGGLTLVKDLDPNHTPLRDVNVDNRNYVRMKRGVIEALGLNGAAFTITEENGGKITIKVQTDAQGNPLPAPVATN